MYVLSLSAGSYLFNSSARRRLLALPPIPIHPRRFFLFSKEPNQPTYLPTNRRCKCGFVIALHKGVSTSMQRFIASTHNPIQSNPVQSKRLAVFSVHHRHAFFFFRGVILLSRWSNEFIRPFIPPSLKINQEIKRWEPPHVRDGTDSVVFVTV